VDYITKPFVAAEVVVRVQRHLTIHHLRRQLQEQNERLQQANEALSREIAAREQAEQQLLDQERQLATIQERQRIGRELHDDLGQIVGYISLQAQTAQQLVAQDKPAQAQASLERLAQAAQTAHDDLRQHILGIRRPPQPPAKLTSALEQYLAELEQHYGLKTNLNLPPGFHAPLTPQANTQLLRIIQEALNNVRQHASTDTAQLNFYLDEQQMQVVIQDQGCGFDSLAWAAAPAQHFGLHIMRERAAQVGGSLEVQSAPGQGTRITASVPRSLVPRPETTGPGNADDGRKLRFLLVDDHPVFLQSLEKLLTARGLQVVGAARDGLEALEMARALLPDVVLMDVHMPRCDGLEATRRLKAELPDVQVVMLTALADDETLFEALKSGAAGYLPKSLPSEDFYRLLADLTRGEAALAPTMAARVLHEFAREFAHES
ncbi:MAG: response regulator, partial [Delftia sp.]|nr:response regulator [Delftia sp.]